MKKIALIPVVAIGLLLLYAAQDFPEWGDPASPASSSPVSSHFISNTGVDTEVPNMVTAVLADYRGFDTMFETVVVFIAGLAVLAILKNSKRGRGTRKDHEVDAEPEKLKQYRTQYDTSHSIQSIKAIFLSISSLNGP